MRVKRYRKLLRARFRHTFRMTLSNQEKCGVFRKLFQKRESFGRSNRETLPFLYSKKRSFFNHNFQTTIYNLYDVLIMNTFCFCCKMLAKSCLIMLFFFDLDSFCYICMYVTYTPKYRP